jgi:RNA recognition motif-containing protein
MTKRLHVSNLGTDTTERDLTRLFEQAGPVVSVRIMRDRDSGRSKGFGFVELESEAAEHAISQLHQTEFHGLPLSVSEARERPHSSAEQGVPPIRLFVGNLPYETTGAELKEWFSTVGLVSSVLLPVEREGGKPRGFAFVEFPDPAHATEAIRRFHNQSFKGRALAVSEARARESRPAAPFSPRPSQPQTERTAAAPLEEQPSRQGRPHRQFGVDAAPQGSRKRTRRSPQAERDQRKPLRERKSGQFFGGVEEEPSDSPFLEDPFTSERSDPESDEQS